MGNHKGGSPEKPPQAIFQPVFNPYSRIFSSVRTGNGDRR